jgi:hypothetical protein
MKKKLFLLAALILLVGCSSKPNLYINNEPAAKNIYVMQSTASPVSAIVALYAVNKRTDKDGSDASEAEFLSLTEDRALSREKYSGLFVRIALVNPMETPVNLFEHSHTYLKNGEVVGKGERIAQSILQTRTFILPLPFNEDATKVSWSLVAADDKGKELFRVGELRYELTGKVVVVAKPIEKKTEPVKKVEAVKTAPVPATVSAPSNSGYKPPPQPTGEQDKGGDIPAQKIGRAHV